MGLSYKKSRNYMSVSFFSSYHGTSSVNRSEEKLTATLSDAQKEIFEKYKDCSREISEISEQQSFITGFNLGAKIVIESMT